MTPEDRERLTEDPNYFVEFLARLHSQEEAISSVDDDPEVVRLREKLAEVEQEIQERLEERRKAEEIEQQRIETANRLEILSQELAEAEARLAEVKNPKGKSSHHPDRAGSEVQDSGDMTSLLGIPSDTDSLPAEERSAWWLIWEIANEGKRQGNPLTSEEADLLRCSILSLPSEARERTIALNNKVVDLARAAMDRAKSQGVPTSKARPGLRIPTKWFDHYNTIYDRNLDWNLSGIMQNCMLQNPGAGERSNWKSR